MKSRIGVALMLGIFSFLSPVVIAQQTDRKASTLRGTRRAGEPCHKKLDRSKRTYPRWNGGDDDELFGR